MMREFQIEFGALRGLGPDEMVKTIPVGLDDIEDGTPEPFIRDMAIAEGKQTMRALGFERFWVREIHGV